MGVWLLWSSTNQIFCQFVGGTICEEAVIKGKVWFLHLHCLSLSPGGDVPSVFIARSLEYWEDDGLEETVWKAWKHWVIGDIECCRAYFLFSLIWIASVFFANLTAIARRREFSAYSIWIFLLSLFSRLIWPCSYSSCSTGKWFCLLLFLWCKCSMYAAFFLFLSGVLNRVCFKRIAHSFFFIVSDFLPLW